MAEGTQAGLGAVELTEESVETAEATPEILPPLPLGPAVRLKERVPPKEAVANMTREVAEAGQLLQRQEGILGGWWPSFAYENPPQVPLVLTPSRSHFTQWRERRISEDEWSYFTAVGSQTLDVIREMFGPSGFQAPGAGGV